MSENYQKVVDIIVDKLGLRPEEITLDSDFTADLGADSLDIVELILEFEKVFSIIIPEDQAEHIKTVRHIIDFIEKQPKNNS